MTDPVDDLIAREREVRAPKAAATRTELLNRLYEELGTWQKVADATGQKLAAVHKAAKQPKKGTTP